MITKNYQICGYDITANNNIKPSTYLRFMQDAANEDAKRLGANYNSMKSNGMIFVISKMRVELTDTPQFDSTVSVRTWNNSISGVTFQREYELSCDGAVFGKATSRWALINYKTRQLLRADALKSCVTTNADEDIGVFLQRRIKHSENAIQITNNYKVTLSDLDANGHVNNCRYGDYIIDYSGIDLSYKKIVAFEIHYLSEMMAGDEVCFASEIDNNVSNVIVTNSNKKQIFSATLCVI